MELVCAKLGKSGGKLAYSSRSGRPTDPWLVPDVNDVIRAEAAAGKSPILFITIGFIADHVEVLFDQDVEAGATAKEVGIQLHRTQTVGVSPLFIRMMADVIIARAGKTALPVQTQSTATVYRDGHAEQAVGQGSPVCFCNPGSVNPPCLQFQEPAHV
jgi:hypothetical protein